MMEELEGSVWSKGPSGERIKVHDYQGGDYGLLDIVEFFQLGEGSYDEAEREVLDLIERDVDRLKVQADAYSFDHEPGLIALCLDIHRFAKAQPQARYRFLSDF